MPTGYTDALYQGTDQTFSEFAMSCARAFGAAITMRDEPNDRPIPDEFQPSTYHVDALAKARARLTEVQGWTPDRAEAEAASAHADDVASHRAALESAAARRGRYETMLARVDAWEPPTIEHVNFKEFMHNQLVESIRFDCSTDYLTPPEAVPPIEYQAAQIKRALDDIEYHAAEQEKEVARVAGRNQWIRALRESLA